LKNKGEYDIGSYAADCFTHIWPLADQEHREVMKKYMIENIDSTGSVATSFFVLKRSDNNDQLKNGD
jgi:hypothetical protein